MDIGLYLGKLINIKTIVNNAAERDSEIEKYRKYAEKETITCPFCMAKLLLRAGDIRDIHFSHTRGKTCQLARAYDSYQDQVSRENKKHSVIKEIIYTDLKGQERIKSDLKVEYGYKEKGRESWRYYPDIYINNNGREFAVSIITNVHEIGDDKVVQLINRRTKYFRDRGLQTIWFVEDRELAEDSDHNMLHLWEAEYGLTIKTAEDSKWDQLLEDLSEEFPDMNIPALFGYQAHAPLIFDVRSLYYVHSKEDSITISVHRLILDQKKTPYRAFSLTRGYQLSISHALIVRDEILLSDVEQEDKARTKFASDLILKVEERRQRLTSINEGYMEQPNPIAEVRQPIPEQSRFTSPTTDSSNADPDFDLTGSILMLKNCSISEAEAKQLYYYVRFNRSDLADYGLTLKDLDKMIQFALGRIQAPQIRKWLVDIQFL
ncbi:competence protein CoiA [Paenibacillus sp. p3-SID867]|uniref:competence protein CoiA family protein n=1 Tax=Paenibacillus sp. p3-SID867 TaxID=2916363 RepID=UPI0021A454D0|nr:competence protein CoiA family protein [Paenibacillus sp. p3-SID867]MCT1402937.1 competence protein CoiA [Paenibacillus sp. p3-SID867]